MAAFDASCMVAPEITNALLMASVTPSSCSVVYPAPRVALARRVYSDTVASSELPVLFAIVSSFWNESAATEFDELTSAREPCMDLKASVRRMISPTTRLAPRAENAAPAARAAVPAPSMEREA
ncbi:hypothetical protein D3C86_1039680 [compost metagenome]